jgi:hypothetical protein
VQCKTCKYFAVPLTAEQQATRHCPGANPLGDAAMKECQLKDKPGFESVHPDKCPYYFPLSMRFR